MAKISAVGQSPNLYDAYDYYVQGDNFRGRTTHAAFYRNGINNPRATLYEGVIELKEIVSRDIPENVSAEAHKYAIKELYDSDHLMVVSTKKALENELRQKYSPNTRWLSEIVMVQTQLPIFKNIHKMSKFFKRLLK